VDKLTIKLQFGRYEYVVEADIKGFVDNINHDWMIRMLAERVDDKALLWLIFHRYCPMYTCITHWICGLRRS